MSSDFDLTSSFERAHVRLERPRKRRSDAGTSRLHPQLDKRLTRLFRTSERPSARDVQRELAALAARIGIRAPARATIYNAIERCRPERFRVADLPLHVQQALYNVDHAAELDGALVAFYAFNHGNVPAVCWAAGMPWLALHHAARMRGWRQKSRGLLLAAMERRRIS